MFDHANLMAALGVIRPSFITAIRRQVLAPAWRMLMSMLPSASDIAVKCIARRVLAEDYAVRPDSQAAARSGGGQRIAVRVVGEIELPPRALGDRLTADSHLDRHVDDVGGFPADLERHLLDRPRERPLDDLPALNYSHLLNPSLDLDSTTPRPARTRPRLCRGFRCLSFPPSVRSPLPSRTPWAGSGRPPPASRRGSPAYPRRNRSSASRSP